MVRVNKHNDFLACNKLKKLVNVYFRVDIFLCRAR